MSKYAAGPHYKHTVVAEGQGEILQAGWHPAGNLVAANTVIKLNLFEKLRGFSLEGKNTHEIASAIAEAIREVDLNNANFTRLYPR